MISAVVTYNPSAKGWNFPVQEAAENEQRKRCHEQRLLNTVSPTVLQSNPAFGWRVGKKIWQWSDCSPYTSNPTISDPYMSCAGNRKASLRSSSSGRQPPKAKGKGQVISRKPGSHSSIADATTFSSLLTKQRRGMSRAAAHLSHLFREPAAWICFLLFCPTTCLLLEKQPRAAKNLQSSKSQNND